MQYRDSQVTAMAVWMIPSLPQPDNIMTSSGGALHPSCQNMKRIYFKVSRTNASHTFSRRDSSWLDLGRGDMDYFPTVLGLRLRQAKKIS